jgi:hypothetical protein
MAEDPAKAIVETDAWQDAMNQRQFKVAVRVGIDAYLQGEAEGDEQASMAALGLIHLAMAELLFGEQEKAPQSAPSCSFCGQGGPEVRLGAGPTAYICADCVGIFYEEAGLRPNKSPEQS